jgi:aryl-alcohol dehydrogenase-like predicted oxidoreductase
MVDDRSFSETAIAKEGILAMTNNQSRRSFLIQSAVAATAAALTGSASAAAKRVPVRNPKLPAGASGTIWIGGDLQVNRIGLGTAEFTGPDRWGEPGDPAAVLTLLRRAIDLGVNFIDTADVYGPGVAERLIHDALHPYPSDLVITTKGGQTHDVRGELNKIDARPEHLRAACEGSLKRLGVEQIALYQLHSLDKTVPYEDSIGELGRLQKEGKIRHIGVSNVDAALLAKARSIVTVASVQNGYNVYSRRSDEILSICERDNIAFIPSAPLGGRFGQVNKSEEGRIAGLEALAKERQISVPQAVLGWLLARSPIILAIPGTTKIEHLEDNVAAAKIRLTKEEMARLG